MVAGGIIQARITAAVLRDYDGMRVKKMFKCTNFTYCEDIPQFTNTALTNCGRDGSKLAFYLLERHCAISYEDIDPWCLGIFAEKNACFALRNRN